jgi:hypothetical protein
VERKILRLTSNLYHPVIQGGILQHNKEVSFFRNCSIYFKEKWIINKVLNGFSKIIDLKVTIDESPVKRLIFEVFVYCRIIFAGDVLISKWVFSFIDTSPQLNLNILHVGSVIITLQSIVLINYAIEVLNSILLNFILIRVQEIGTSTASKL